MAVTDWTYCPRQEPLVIMRPDTSSIPFISLPPYLWSQVFKCTSKISEFPPLKHWTPNSLFGGFTRRHVRREYLCENAQQTNERQRCKTIKGYAYLRSPQIWRTLTHERLGFRRSRPIWTTVMVITSLFTTRSLNASQPNFATCAEVNQIWKKISKIWGFLL